MTDILKMFQEDDRHFIESSLSIVNKDSVKQSFILNRAQRDYWPKITPRDLILKSRKIGFTSLRLARMVARARRMPHRHGIVVSHEEKSTMRILERAVYLIRNSNIKINCDVTGYNLVFPDTESKIWIGTAGSKAFGRGDDITDYELTEYAFWQNPGLLVGIEEGCMNDAEGCIESTANGWGTPYHKMWQAAEAKLAYTLDQKIGPRFYRPHFYGWFWDDACRVPCPKPLEELDEKERWLRKALGVKDDQLLWRRLKIASMVDATRFEQEYPATPEEAFLVAGMMVFSPEAIRQQEGDARPITWQGEIRDVAGRAKLEPTKADPVSKVNPGRLSIWIPPRRNSRYLATADVAAGIEIPEDFESDETGCYSVWDVFDIETWEQVAQWRGLVPPEEFGEIGVMLGMLYNEALLAPEVNNHGLVTCTTIRNFNYRHLYTREDSKGGTDMGFYTMPGVSGTRARLINSLRSVLRDLAIKINSPATFSDLRAFVKKAGGKMGPQTGAFSDCVISAGIAALILEEKGTIPERKGDSGRTKLTMMNRGAPGAVHYPARGGYG